MYFDQVSTNDKVPQVIVYRLVEDGLEFRGIDELDAEFRDTDFVIRFQAVGD